MKLFNNIRNYIGEDEFKIVVYKDKINIINYKDINDIKDNRIVVSSDNEVLINGLNLKVQKVLDNELLISGLVKEIIINE